MTSGAVRMRMAILVVAAGIAAAAPCFADGTTPSGSGLPVGAPAASQGSGSSQSPGGPPLTESEIASVPTDGQASYTVGVAAFRAVDVSTENSYLLQAIPLLIYQAISGITKHEYTPAELGAYKRRIVGDAIEKAEVSLDTLLRARSTLAMSSNATEASMKNADASIASMQKRIEFLRQLDPSKVSVADSKPAKFVEKGQGRQLLDPPVLSPADTARSMGLDFLVWGTITEVSDYLLVQVRGYDKALGREVVSVDDAVSPNGALKLADNVTQSITQALLGRDFADVVIDCTPSSALLYLDGGFVGVGNASVERIRPGVHKLEAKAPGYVGQTVEFDIAPFETKTLNVSLAASERPRIVVRSVPAGANVYLSSTWVGTTPLLVDRPESDIALTLRMKDYADYITSLSPSSPKALTVKMVPDSFHYDGYVASLRQRFYNSFGAFALSVIAPVSFYSLLQDYNNRIQASSNSLGTSQALSQYQHFVDLWHIWYYAYWGSFFVSAALFANVAVDIGAYLGGAR